MVLIYILSFLFSFGVAAGPYFLYKAKATTLKLFRAHYPIAGFILFELVLVLVWPAAVPRLFIPILPFFILVLTVGIFEFVAKERVNRTAVGIVLLILLGLYVIGQYVLRLQFLVSSRSYFMAITLVQLVIAAACLSKTKKYLPVLVFLSSLLWSFFVIDAHRLIFISVKNAGEYVAQNLSGTVAYNDVSSVSDWYTNYKGSTTRGFYYNTDSKKNLDYKNLLSAGIDYLIITNEHNTTMTLDLEKRPYLELLKEFRYNVNGSEFFAKVIKLRKN